LFSLFKVKEKILSTPSDSWIYEKTKTLLADQIIKEITLLREEYDKAIKMIKFSVVKEIRDKIKIQGVK